MHSLLFKIEEKKSLGCQFGRGGELVKGNKTREEGGEGGEVIFHTYPSCHQSDKHMHRRYSSVYTMQSVTRQIKYNEQVLYLLVGLLFSCSFRHDYCSRNMAVKYNIKVIHTIKFGFNHLNINLRTGHTTAMGKTLS